jgi:predicted CXXCH cytochrome family protein
MTARARKFLLMRRLSLVLFVAASVALIGIWAGCSNEHERYETLSFFFDGVPNPDAPKHAAVATTEPDQATTVVTLAIVSRHKPYIDRKCAACHRNDSGNIMEFEEAYKSCTKCHTKVTTEYPHMHGPVATSGLPGTGPTCKWCHQPHESTEPYLLKDRAAKVCTQCHDTQLLSPKPVQHTDGTSCIQCHYGHGSSKQISHFLKPIPTPQWPTTQPATRPATQPATQPTAAAGQPAVEPLGSVTRDNATQPAATNAAPLHTPDRGHTP